MTDRDYWLDGAGEHHTDAEERALQDALRHDGPTVPPVVDPAQVEMFGTTPAAHDWEAWAAAMDADDFRRDEERE